MAFKELFLKRYLTQQRSTKEEKAEPERPQITRSKILSVINQKGGCGKTTTVVNLSACLADMQYRTLIIDLDPQAHSSLGVGVNIENLDKHIYHVLKTPEYAISDIILSTYNTYLKVAPTNTLLAASLVELVNSIGREGLLKEHTDKCKASFDFIIIDCPPSLNLLTVNALTASDAIVVPIQTHYYSLEGMKELFRTIEHVKNRLNPGLEICGILPTMYDRRTKVARTMLEALKDYFKEQLFNTVISINSALAEAPIYGKPITEYNPKSKGAHDYKQLAEEILNKYGSRSIEERYLRDDILDVQQPQVVERFAETV